MFTSIVRYSLEELRFLRSLDDLRNLRDKVAYKLPRKVGPLERSPGVPLSLQIEPTNVCNLRCTTCSVSRTSLKRGYMDVGLFQNIVSEASEIGVKRIYLYMHGEPMLHPKIVEMIGFIKSKGLAVHMTTNGTLLGPETSAELLSAGVNSADHLTISFLGHSKESHEAIMVGVDHDVIVRNVTELLRLRKELRVNGPVIETILHPTPETQHEIEEYLRFWRDRVDHARLGEISISFQEYKKAGASAVTRTGPCNTLLTRMPICWNGRVPLCVMDVDGDWTMGDLNENSITEIWNSEQLRAIRRLHEQRQFEKLPFCLHCDI